MALRFLPGASRRARGVSEREEAKSGSHPHGMRCDWDARNSL